MRKIKIIAYALLLGAAGFFAAAFVAEKISAADVSGWLWGGTEEVSDGVINGNETGVYWVSMSRKNCDSNGDGVTGGDIFPDCPVGQPITTDANYGVDIPVANGSVTGYAWSGTLGWIDFNPQNHCVVSPAIPGAGQYQAASCTPPSGSAGVQRSGNNLTGWARIVSIAQASVTGNSGGWTGWVSMKGSNYGVDVTDFDNSYAWSGGEDGIGSELGWIDFSGADINNAPNVYAGADQKNEPSGNATLTGVASDPDGDSLIFEWTQESTTAPSVIINNPDQEIANFNLGSQDNVEYKFKFKATDIHGLSDEDFVSVFACTCDPTTASNTCKGTSYNDSCGDPSCDGTKDCGGVKWQETVQ